MGERTRRKERAEFLRRLLPDEALDRREQVLERLRQIPELAEIPMTTGISENGEDWRVVVRTLQPVDAEFLSSVIGQDSRVDFETFDTSVPLTRERVGEAMKIHGYLVHEDGIRGYGFDSIGGELGVRIQTSRKLRQSEIEGIQAKIIEFPVGFEGLPEPIPAKR